MSDCFRNIKKCDSGFTVDIKLYIVGTSDIIKDGFIIDYGGADPEYIGHSMYIQNNKLVISVATFSCFYKYEGEILPYQWTHYKYLFKDAIDFGLKVLVNQETVAHITECTGRSLEQRSPIKSVYIGSNFGLDKPLGKFFLFSLSIIDSYQLSNDESKDYYVKGGSTFDIMKGDYVYGERKERSLKVQNEYQIPFQLKNGAKLEYGSLYFLNHVNYDNGYAISTKFFKSCVTNTKYCTKTNSLWSIWLKISSGSGIHLWIGDALHTHIQVTNNNKNMSMIINGRNTSCASWTTIDYNSWMLIQMRFNFTSHGQLKDEVHFFVNNVVINVSYWDSQVSFEQDTDGFIILGAKMNGNINTIGSLGNGRIDDLLYMTGSIFSENFINPVGIFDIYGKIFVFLLSALVFT